MSYSPPGQPVPSMVGTWTPDWSPMAEATVHGSASPASGVLSTTAAYYALLVPVTCVARRLWWANGATVSASYNIDVGIYLDAGGKPGTRLVSSGATAQGTASQVQFVDITDTTLAPGRYWLALASSSASATGMRSAMGASFGAAFHFTEAATSVLPATATPAEGAAANVYLCGFATTP